MNEKFEAFQRYSHNLSAIAAVSAQALARLALAYLLYQGGSILFKINSVLGVFVHTDAVTTQELKQAD